MPEFTRTEISITSTDGIVLEGNLLSKADDAPLVVLCHGIPLSVPAPGDPGYALPQQDLARAGYQALFVNFRGCGESTGNFHLGGWYSDLVSIIDFVRGELDPPKVFLAGFSAGGAVAIEYVARRGGINGIAAYAAAARLTEVFPRENLLQLIEAARDVGIIRDTGFPPTPDWFYDDLKSHEAADFIASVSPVPLLIVHGGNDELVPVSQADALFEAAGDPKQLVILDGGEHRLRHDPRSIETLLGWLRRLN